MASETSSFSQSPLTITTNDEFEWLEMAEFDANTINELLYEPTEVESVETLVQDIEVIEATESSPVKNHWCLDEIGELENFNWLDNMVEQEILAPCNDVADWYGATCMEEINQVHEIGDYSLSHKADLYDEIGYIGLWQENYD
ncbi:hypothetical protein CASFOL_022432 [Castilleja foliolosa]|uniref:Uncharacterized protein n=1 Tax=Castilleja foliolosa TaxID=1961234 RepID=A0ABD3CYC7_9LAMI